jgi:hypothetical protein
LYKEDEMLWKMLVHNQIERKERERKKKRKKKEERRKK